MKVASLRLLGLSSTTRMRLGSTATLPPASGAWRPAATGAHRAGLRAAVTLGEHAVGQLVQAASVDNSKVLDCPHDDRDVSVLWNTPEACEELEAVHLGHQQIEDDGE